LITSTPPGNQPRDQLGKTERGIAHFKAMALSALRIMHMHGQTGFGHIDTDEETK
jgi:hypothetical protein